MKRQLGTLTSTIILNMLYCILGLSTLYFMYYRPVHGLIFLFKWDPDVQRDGKVVTDGSADHIYFAKQVSV